MAEVLMSEIMARRINGPIYGSQNVKFYYEWLEDKNQSKLQGRPIAKEIEMIEVSNGAERTCVIVNDRHRRDYAAQYEAFLKKDEKATSGTPLCDWAGLPRVAAVEFAWLGIKTLEQLAAVSAETKLSLGNLSIWVDRAANEIEACNSPKKEFSRLKEENKELKLKLEKALEQLNSFSRRIEDVEGARLGVFA